MPSSHPTDLPGLRAGLPVGGAVDVDSIVIGSGAGGLTAALALARGGDRVLVLEQHYLPGGWCHSFPLGGYQFNTGVHYVGTLGPGGGLRRIYEGLGVTDKLKSGSDRAMCCGEALCAFRYRYRTALQPFCGPVFGL